MNNTMRFAETVILVEEGFSPHEYYCTSGYRTTGYGRKISDIKNEPLSSNKTTKAAELMFVRNKVREIEYQLMSRFPVEWNLCSAQRQAVLISMTYQLGFQGVSQFTKMWAAIKNRNFELASIEMLNSKWNKQTPNRAKRHAEVMKRGDMLQYYLTQGQIP